MKNKNRFLKHCFWDLEIFSLFFFPFSFLGFLERTCTCKKLNILQSEHFIMAFRKKLPLNYANCLNQLDKYECEQNAKCCWKFTDMHVIILIIFIVSERSMRTSGKHESPVSVSVFWYLSMLCCFIIVTVS